MNVPIELIVTIIVAIIGSGGFWSFLTARREKKSALTAMVLGLGFKELRNACEEYINQGYISIEDFEELTKYLYLPYRELGGNGTGEALFRKVSKLPNSKDEK